MSSKVKRLILLENLLHLGMGSVQNPCELFEDLEEVELMLSIPTNRSYLRKVLSQFEECQWFEACALVRDKINEYESAGSLECVEE